MKVETYPGSGALAGPAAIPDFMTSDARDYVMRTLCNIMTSYAGDVFLQGNLVNTTVFPVARFCRKTVDVAEFAGEWHS